MKKINCKSWCININKEGIEILANRGVDGQGEDICIMVYFGYSNQYSILGRIAGECKELIKTEANRLHKLYHSI